MLWPRLWNSRRHAIYGIYIVNAHVDLNELYDLAGFIRHTHISYVNKIITFFLEFLGPLSYCLFSKMLFNSRQFIMIRTQIVNNRSARFNLKFSQEARWISKCDWVVIIVHNACPSERDLSEVTIFPFVLYLSWSFFAEKLNLSYRFSVWNLCA